MVIGTFLWGKGIKEKWTGVVEIRRLNENEGEAVNGIAVVFSCACVCRCVFRVNGKEEGGSCVAL